MPGWTQTTTFVDGVHLCWGFTVLEPQTDWYIVSSQDRPQFQADRIQLQDDKLHLQVQLLEAQELII
jgi:hypothetical protein